MVLTHYAAASVPVPLPLCTWATLILSPFSYCGLFLSVPGIFCITDHSHHSRLTSDFMLFTMKGSLLQEASYRHQLGLLTPHPPLWHLHSLGGSQAASFPKEILAIGHQAPGFAYLFGLFFVRFFVLLFVFVFVLLLF